MGSFNPNLISEKCERYLRWNLGADVRFRHAELLEKSSRQAPWRLDAVVDGVKRSFVLQLDMQRGEHEFRALQAVESISIPAPRAYGWDPHGEALGVPCYLSDFLEGESLLGPLLAGEAWAEELYLDTVCDLQVVTRPQLAGSGDLFAGEQTALDFMVSAYAYFQEHPHPLAEEVYRKMKECIPLFPESRFSNGDLWLDNFIVRDYQLVGVIDFEGAGFSDPIYEFLLAFFVEPKLRWRGLEERYCASMGYDPAMLPWYNALEYFDTWHWVRKSGENFAHYNDQNLQEGLVRWLNTGEVAGKNL